MNLSNFLFRQMEKENPEKLHDSSKFSIRKTEKIVRQKLMTKQRSINRFD